MNNKKYTESIDFTSLQPIMEANGEMSEFGINWCEIQTVLIKEAGKCEAYASDILIDINKILNDIHDFKLKSGQHWYGFRGYGIDHDNFINARMSNQEMYGDTYRCIYCLNIIVTEKGYGTDKDVSMKLYKVPEKKQKEYPVSVERLVEIATRLSDLVYEECGCSPEEFYECCSQYDLEFTEKEKEFFELPEFEEE